MNTPENHLEQRARALYREASQHIDPATAGRLRAARRSALEMHRPAPHKTARWLVPSGACAAIALAAVMAWSPLQHHPVSPSAQTDHSSVQLAYLDEGDSLPPDPVNADPKLYQNLDFYDWLAANGDSQASR